MHRLLLWIATGLGLGLIVVTLLASFDAVVWVIPVGLAVFSLGWGWRMVTRRDARGERPGTARATAAAVQAGRVALARVDRVLELEGRGFKGDRTPLCRVDVTVAATDRPPFRTRILTRTPGGSTGDFGSGQLRVVALLAASGPDLAFMPVPASGPRWASVVVPEADDAGELTKQSPDVPLPDGSAPPVSFWLSRRLRPVRFLAQLMVVAAVAALVVVPVWPAVDVGLENLRAGEGLHPTTLRPEPLRIGLARLARESGTDRVTHVEVTPETITAQMLAGADGRSVETWTYYRGTVTRGGPGTVSETRVRPFALSEVRWEALWPATQRVCKDLVIPEDQVAVTVWRPGQDDAATRPGTAGRVPGVRLRLTGYHPWVDATFSLQPDGSGLAKEGNWKIPFRRSGSELSP